MGISVAKYISHCRKETVIFLSLGSPSLGVRERMREGDRGVAYSQS